jgi:hypothetical protein
LLIVHLRVYNTPGTPLKDEAGFAGLEIVPPVPEIIVHKPVPDIGVLAARVAEVVPHISFPV